MLIHFKATQEYDTTRNILHVKEILGHRNINSTLVYTHLVPFDEEAEAYYHATAKDDKRALRKLESFLNKGSAMNAQRHREL